MAGVELEEAMPHGPPKAISLVETGRWHRGDGEFFAWPWTVANGGSGTAWENPVSNDSGGALEMPVSVALENPKSHVPANVAAKLRPRIAVDWQRTAL